MMRHFLLSVVSLRCGRGLNVQGKCQQTVVLLERTAGAWLLAELNSTPVSRRFTPFPSSVPVLTHNSSAQLDAFQFY